MKRVVWPLVLIVCALLVTACAAPQAEPAAPTATPASTEQPAATPTIPPSPTEAPTEAPATATATMVPAATETPAPTATVPATATATPTESTATTQIVMQDVSFDPAEIQVEPGTTVTWTNQDAFPHTVTAGTRDNPTGLFESGNISADGTFSFTFEEPGTYEYFCSIHDGMRGVIVVGEGDASDSQSSDGSSGGTDDGGEYDY